MFFMGGPLFMGILTLMLLVILTATVVYILAISSGGATGRTNFRHQLTYLKSLGLFTMVTGILGQLMGLMQAFKAIERVGDISPPILLGGLKVSMISTVYGIFIYLFSLMLWFLLDLWYHQRTRSNN